VVSGEIIAAAIEVHREFVPGLVGLSAHLLAIVRKA